MGKCEKVREKEREKQGTEERDVCKLEKVRERNKKEERGVGQEEGYRVRKRIDRGRVRKSKTWMRVEK